MTPDNLLDIIIALRESGLRQADIQRETGIPQYRLSRWERDINLPAGANDALKLLALYQRIKRNEPAAAA